MPVSEEKFTGATVQDRISPSTTASTFVISFTIVKRPRFSSSSITACVTRVSRPSFPERSLKSGTPILLIEASVVIPRPCRA